jgi:hypothetical protein
MPSSTPIAVDCALREEVATRSAFGNALEKLSGEPHSATPEELLERHRLSSTAIEREALAVAA